MIEITELVGTALVQDLGRPGMGHLGISPSGAADRTALVDGNTALGNAAGAAGVELVGSLSLRSDADLLVAVTGAPARVSVGRAAVDPVLVPVPAGALLRIEPPSWGWRCYLTVAGGLHVPPVLGSAATDTLSGLGPAPIQAGDRIAVGTDHGSVPTRDPHRLRHVPDGALVMLDAGPGPRSDWVRDLPALFDRPWQVSELADRVGTRLIGQPLTRAITRELPSEAVVTGSVQLPPNGQPVILGPDHPVTGGYPVIAVLTESAAGALAQARPGITVRFRRAADLKGGWI
ncbi:MAG: biotin-dependent carboxyltransferase family protein [Beutenbergiaceae bacterium]